MPYGKPKLPVNQIKRLILDAVREKLDQNPMFQNDSLSFYSFHCAFNIGLTVTARAEDKAIITGAIGGGEAPQEEKRGPETKTPEAVSVKASGEIKKP